MPTEMNRRAVLLGLFTATAILGDDDVGAQEPSTALDPSLYIPKAHVVDELKFLHDFMEEFSFVMLVQRRRPCASRTFRRSWIAREDGSARFAGTSPRRTRRRPRSTGCIRRSSCSAVHFRVQLEAGFSLENFDLAKAIPTRRAPQRAEGPARRGDRNSRNRSDACSNGRGAIQSQSYRARGSRSSARLACAPDETGRRRSSVVA
jgi:hypothetical protein